MIQNKHKAPPFRDGLFLERLKLLEYHHDILQNNEAKFVQDMRRLYDSRSDAEELGFPMWEPTAKQHNYMNSLLERYGLR